MMKLYLVVLAMLMIAFEAQAARARGAAALENASLPSIALKTLHYHFNKDERNTSLSQFASRFSLTEPYKRSAGLFVTLSKNGKTRACWGSVFPEHADLVTATVFTTEAAITKEYRFPPLKKEEIKDLKAQVTVVKAVEPVSSYREINPFRHGLFVRSGARAAVILPGEAKDAYYQLVLSKLKAGIPSRSPCQIYRIQTDVFR